MARAVLTKYCGPVLATIATTVATAMLIAIGILIKSKNIKTENNNNTII
jgi:type III secretory pathway component EscU